MILDMLVAALGESPYQPTSPEDINLWKELLKNLKKIDPTEVQTMIFAVQTSKNNGTYQVYSMINGDRQAMDILNAIIHVRIQNSEHRPAGAGLH